MTNKWSGIKSLIRYYQSDEPINPKVGQIWYNPESSFSYIFNIDNEWQVIRGHISDWEYSYSVGFYTPSGYVSNIDRFSFPFDIGNAAYIGNGYSSNPGSGSCCNSSFYGYITGGGGVSYISRFAFPFNVGTSTFVGNVGTGAAGSCASPNSSSHGYICGGGGYLSHISRILFPFTSGSSTKVGDLAQGKYGCATCNS